MIKIEFESPREAIIFELGYAEGMRLGMEVWQREAARKLNEVGVPFKKVPVRPPGQIEDTVTT